MADLTPEAMAAKLMAAPFERSSPTVTAVTDPIADTPMVVTLDELRPYDRNPRVTRNPLYEALKDSIRSRGLDSPPSITRRPAEAHYIIRNGGNTRLAILRELWTETKDEQFFRLKCLFRPWTARGEIVALTGHLAENELHGGLTFIERALGVAKARELYEQELGESLSQRELARRLTADGYPISQSHISRMQETVSYLLPAIPSILYAGLGRGLAERLTILRRDAAQAWALHAHRAAAGIDFPQFFQDVLSSFDENPSAFAIERVRDELIGQMAQVLKIDYDTVALKVADTEMRQRILTPDSPAVSELGWPDERTAPAARRQAGPTHPAVASPSPASRTPATHLPNPDTESAGEQADCEGEHDPEVPVGERVQAHIVSPAETTPRLEALQRTIAEATGEAAGAVPAACTVPTARGGQAGERFEENVIRAIPVQAGGLYPISDVWYIEPAIDVPDRLRVHIGQLAREIAHEAGIAHRIESSDEGIGYYCTPTEPGAKGSAPTFLARAVLSLLAALRNSDPARRPVVDGIRMMDDLAPLLQGVLPFERNVKNTARLSDAGLVKLYRLIRLTRRLVDLESTVGEDAPP